MLPLVASPLLWLVPGLWIVAPPLWWSMRHQDLSNLSAARLAIRCAWGATGDSGLGGFRLDQQPFVLQTVMTRACLRRQSRFVWLRLPA